VAELDALVGIAGDDFAQVSGVQMGSRRSFGGDDCMWPRTTATCAALYFLVPAI
jgi:hypothetical protein